MTKDRSLIFYWSLAIPGTVLFYFLVTKGSFDLLSPDNHLSLAYNYYFLSLLNGQVDVPLRIIGREGHYTAQGEAFMYYGLFPALLRVVFWPFVDLTQTSVARISVLTASLLTALCLQHLSLHWIKPYLPSKASWRLGVLGAIAIAVWFCSPAVFLASNAVILHEPIGWGVAAFVFSVWLLRSHSNITWKHLIVLGLATAVAVHSRAHVGLALCFLSAGIGLWFALDRLFVSSASKTFSHSRAIGPDAVGVLGLAALVLVAGLGYLYLNELRFGSSTEVHGTAQGATVYGFLFLGPELPSSPRVVAWETVGFFSPLRILPNSIYYAIGGHSLNEKFVDLFGLIDINKGGGAPLMVLYFFPWVAGAAFAFAHGLRSKFRPVTKNAGVKLGFVFVSLIPAIVILSYATVQLRYAFEIWMFALALSSIGIPKFSAIVHERSRAPSLATYGISCALAAVLVLAMHFNVGKMKQYQHAYVSEVVMSKAECMSILQSDFPAAGLPPSVCDLPAAVEAALPLL